MSRASVRAWFDRLSGAVLEWCQGRSWIWRAPLLLYLAYAGLRHFGSAEYTSLFGGINLGIHELGHVLTSWAGQWICALGGTLFQCLAPLVSALLFLRQPDFFAVPVCGWWLGDNLYGVATYMADARALELPLVTVGPEGGEVEHDWNYLLDSVGLLQHDTSLAAVVRAGAFLLTWSSIAAAVWMCWQMARGRR